MDIESMRVALKRARIAQGLTLARLAERAGTSLGYIHEIETGSRTPSLAMLEKLTKILGVTVEFNEDGKKGRIVMRL